MAGRPRHHGEVKRSALNLKTSPELRDRIAASAERRGLSRTQEVERVLVEHYRDEDWLGGSDTAAFVRLLAASIEVAERRTGASWSKDLATWDAVREVVDAALAANRPFAHADAAVAADVHHSPLSETSVPPEATGYSHAAWTGRYTDEEGVRHSIPLSGLEDAFRRNASKQNVQEPPAEEPDRGGRSARPSSRGGRR